MRRTQLRRAAPPSPVRARPAVEIRPARMDDAERIRDFVCGLSLKSQSQRFFAGVTRPSASLLKSMITRDDRRDALLAVVDDDVVIGHVMGYVTGDCVEIAVVIADAWQSVGLGGRLVRTLLRRSCAATVSMDVLGDNRKVLSMVRHIWPDATMRVSSGSVEIKARNPFAKFAE
ncbi:GNAT family N-acetyltransferase [Streptosporangiaceae bacterium NEAU-GS5]|nr:GNAT family N-acetyltransferase [Streptosporangiaceae bacterium NEAU-GS5]